MEITTIYELDKRIKQYEDDISKACKQYNKEPLVFPETDYEECTCCGSRMLKAWAQSFQESGYHSANNEMLRLKKIRDKYLIDVEIYNRRSWIRKLFMKRPSLHVVTYDY